MGCGFRALFHFSGIALYDVRELISQRIKYDIQKPKKIRFRKILLGRPMRIEMACEADNPMNAIDFD